jgi:SAM-dependent methyltransferase
MKHIDYLRTWGHLPDFEDVFGFGGNASVGKEQNAVDPKVVDDRKHRLASGEPAAYLGDQPTFSDFLDEINISTYQVLDVGCGPGKFRQEINLRGQYIGLDFDSSLNPEFVCDFNHEPFPFPDGSFDFVFSDSVMEHVMDPVAVMDEIYRVLKQGGRGFILVPFHYKAHGSPWEFFRFSKGGVHLILRRFTDIEIYPIGGSLSVICHILWNFGRLLDRIHGMVGNIYRLLVWCIFKILNPLDRYDPYKIFTRGHYAFFSKPTDEANNG